MPWKRGCPLLNASTGFVRQLFMPSALNGEEPEDARWVLDFVDWANVCKTWLNRLDAPRWCFYAGEAADHLRVEKAMEKIIAGRTPVKEIKALITRKKRS